MNILEYIKSKSTSIAQKGCSYRCTIASINYRCYVCELTGGEYVTAHERRSERELSKEERVNFDGYTSRIILIWQLGGFTPNLNSESDDIFSTRRLEKWVLSNGYQRACTR